MKKIFITVILFLIAITSNIQAQKVFANPAYYDSVTTLNYNSTLQVRYNDETKIISWWRLQSLLGSSSTLLSSNNSWSGTNTFTNQIIIPSSLSASLQYGIGFNSGLFAWSDGNGDSLHYGASRAWVIDYVNTNGYEGDLTAYMTKAGTETVSGIKTYTNVNNFISGTVYLPVKGSYSALTGNQQLFINSTNGKVIAQTKDGSNNKYDLTFASEDWVNANFTNLTNVIPATGTKTGITSTITATSGTWNLYKVIPQQLILPEDPATKVTNMLYYDLDNGESGLHIHGRLYMPDDEKVQNMIDGALSYEYPEVVTATTDTLNFRMNNYIATRYTVPSNTTIYISNSSPGWVSFVVNGTLNTVSILAKNNAAASTWGTIKWTNGIAPTFSNTYAVYQVSLQRLDADEILGSWVFHQ